MRRLMTISLLTTMLTILLSACGQTGPLYLPEHAPEKASPGTTQPAPEPVATESAASGSAKGGEVN